MTSQEPLDLTKRKEPLSLSEISRAFELGSRSTAQKWHKHQIQKAMGGKAPAAKPVLRAVAEAMGVDLDEEQLNGQRPRYPVEVVLALGKALGYLDAQGKLVEEIRDKGRGRWLPVAPTVDPASKRRRVYINHLAQKMGVNNATVEMAKYREVAGIVPPDGTDEIDRIFWWVPTANKMLKNKDIKDLF
ncbi:hypothetical protein [Streptomyces sp. NPDC001889]